MRTVTTLQGSEWNNKLSRKGIPSRHCWRRQIKRQVSPHGHGERTEHKELQFQALRAQWAPDHNTDQRRVQAEDYRKGVKRKISCQSACLQVPALESKRGKEKKTRERLRHGCILKKSQPCKTQCLQV